ncbi:MAG: hypothetical protein KPEEDBHJ_02704 [Anaerolineales bacterium]|nr:hypothetical protein [Anaerolineales bacterium]
MDVLEFHMPAHGFEFDGGEGIFHFFGFIEEFKDALRGRRSLL